MAIDVGVDVVGHPHIFLRVDNHAIKSELPQGDLQFSLICFLILVTRLRMVRAVVSANSQRNFRDLEGHGVKGWKRQEAASALSPVVLNHIHSQRAFCELDFSKLWEAPSFEQRGLM